MGPSLTGRGPADRAGLVVRDLVVRDLVDLVDLGRAGLVVTGRAGLAVQDLDLGQADLVDPAVLGPAARHPVDLVDIRDRAGRADLGDLAGLDPVGLVVLGRVDRADRVDLTDIRSLADRVDPAVLDPVDPAVLDPAGPVDLGDQGMDPADRVDRAVLDPAGLDPAGRADLGDQGMDPAGRVDLGDLGVPVGRTHPGVLTSGVAPRWAAPEMRLTASAHPTTVRRLHPDNTDSAGMAGLLPERRRLSGTDRRPRVAGAVRRLPVVGTAHGMVRRATWASRSVISGRSITTATTRFRCSTRFSGDGASGSSESGSRCTDTT
jgi:hypothetical protein